MQCTILLHSSSAPKGIRLAKGTKRSKVGKQYLKIHGRQILPSSPGFTTNVTEEPEEQEQLEQQDKLGFQLDYVVIK